MNIQQFTSKIIDYRKAVITSIIVITVFFLFFIPRIKVNPDVFSNLPKEDKTAQLFNTVGEEFGGNYICIIGLESKDVFTHAVLKEIKQITDSSMNVSGIASVSSLTNIIDIKGSDWGMDVGNLVDPYNLPKTKSELQKLKKYVLSKNLYKGGLVSEDASMTIIMARIEEGVDKIKVANTLKEKIKSLNIESKLYFGGQAFVTTEFGHIISRDLLFIGPLSFLFILLVLFIGFRRFKAVIFPILTILISCIWTFGLMGMLGIEISIITSVIPILLIAIGSAYTLHVINRIYKNGGNFNQTDLKKALAYIIVPVFFASITTIFGFLSFVFGSYLDMISKFGLFTSLGIAFSLILSVTFIPALFAVFPDKKAKGSETDIESKTTTNKFLTSISQVVINHPKRVLAIWCTVILLFTSGIFMIDRSVDILDYFKKNNTNRITEKILQEKLGGTSPVYVSIKGDILKPNVLNSIRETQDYMLKFDGIVSTQSIADLIIEMSDVMGEGRIIPKDEQKIENLWFLLEGQDILERLISYDQNEAIIQATFGSNDMDEMSDFVTKMDSYFEQHKTPDIQFQMTGMPSLMLRFDESIVKSQFQSLAIAIILVLIAISLLSRSFGKGLLAITPILSTLIILYGFMGLVHIPLDLATVLVGSISIGIGIDYSIHMISHINHQLKNNNTLNEAIYSAIGISGKSIFINVVAVSLGFLILLLSSLVPLQRFGILVAVTMLASGLGAMTLLPAILVLKEKHKQNRK